MNLDELQEFFEPINEDENLKWSDKGKSHYITTYEGQEIEIYRFNNADSEEVLVYLRVGESEWQYLNDSEEFNFISYLIDNI